MFCDGLWNLILTVHVTYFADLNQTSGAHLVARKGAFSCARAKVSFYAYIALWTGWELPDTRSIDRAYGTVFEPGS